MLLACTWIVLMRWLAGVLVWLVIGGLVGVLSHDKNDHWSFVQ